MTSSTLSGGIAHTLPTNLEQALIASETTLNLWEALTPIARNEYLCWVEHAKQGKTRQKRISRTVEELLAGHKRPCCWVGCIHRTDKKPGKWQQRVLIDKVSERPSSR